MIALKRKEHRDLLEEKRIIRKQKHTDFCQSLVNNVIDVAMTIQILNNKTHNQIPFKLKNELRQTFIAGLKFEKPETDDVRSILNYNDYQSYSNQTDQWSPISEDNEQQEPINNSILDRFKDQVLLYIKNQALLIFQVQNIAFPKADKNNQAKFF